MGCESVVSSGSGEAGARRLHGPAVCRAHTRSARSAVQTARLCAELAADSESGDGGIRQLETRSDAALHGADRSMGEYALIRGIFYA